jgi:hypothetical protein
LEIQVEDKGGDSLAWLEAELAQPRVGTDGHQSFNIHHGSRICHFADEEGKIRFVMTFKMIPILS